MDQALLDLYNAKILELAAKVERGARLTHPDATISKESPLCGSRITVDLVMQDGKVSDYGQIVKACALGTAASSLMAKLIIGKTAAQLCQLRDDMRALLTEAGSPPGPPFKEFEILTPVVPWKSRHGSVMLPFEAAAEAAEIASHIKSGKN
ncbi:MAG: iron-sulfur cluster assembly scaffold protein [Alphaproteobacteria bacterium]